MHSITGSIDSPQPAEVCRAHRVPVRGWVYRTDGPQEAVKAVRVTTPDGYCAGRTRSFYRRPDVEAALNLPALVPVGFELHAGLPEGFRPEGGECELRVELELLGESAPLPWKTVRFALRADDLRQRDHYHVLYPATTVLFHRDDVYRMGPSSRAVNSEVLGLLLRYLPPSGGTLLDVGCGLGPFGPPLIEQGFRWLGVEVKEEDCRELERAGLPFRQLRPDEPLPFAEGAFESGMCLEVLEHIPQPDGFLSEISRVVRGRTIFSVPNFELVPMMAGQHAAPRHILEPDHKHFFTRFSLGALLRRHFRTVEVLDYAVLPLGNLLEEILPYHLLAIADNAP